MWKTTRYILLHPTSNNASTTGFTSAIVAFSNRAKCEAHSLYWLNNLVTRLYFKQTSSRTHDDIEIIKMSITNLRYKHNKLKKGVTNLTLRNTNGCHSVYYSRYFSLRFTVFENTNGKDTCYKSSRFMFKL